MAPCGGTVTLDDLGQMIPDGDQYDSATLRGTNWRFLCTAGAVVSGLSRLSKFRGNPEFRTTTLRFAQS
jgi:hypothetical protein